MVWGPRWQGASRRAPGCAHQPAQFLASQGLESLAAMHSRGPGQILDAIGDKPELGHHG
jgi:hypothetical protein